MDEDDFDYDGWLRENRAQVSRDADGWYRDSSGQVRGRVIRETSPNFPGQSGIVSASKLVDPTTSNEVVRVTSIEDAQARLVKALQDFAGIQALMDRFNGSQPPVGTVLRWIKRFDNRSGELVLQARDREAMTFSVNAPGEYVYLAFRAPGGKWYVTSQRGSNLRDWDQLLAEIGDNPCEIASDWTEVPAPEKVNADAIDPVAWARQTFGKKSDAAAQSE